MKDINYKSILAFSVPYLTICAVLWHIGYWSTFKINILQHLNSGDIIKSFLYPFISSVFLYFGGQIIYKAFSKNKLEHGSAERSMTPKNLKRSRIIIGILIIGIAIGGFIFLGSEKWIFIAFISSVWFGVTLNNKDFMISIIPDRNIRLNFVNTIILIPFLSFGLAKTNSLKIIEDIRYATIVSIENKHASENILITEKYKLLGITNDYVFVMPLDNKSIIMIEKTEIKKIEIERNAP